MTSENIILIVGAGPVGLTLACLLAQAGTPFRLVDAKAGIVCDSRALGVHARTLEQMQSLGLTKEFIRAGRVTRHMTFHNKNTSLFSFDFNILSKATEYPFYLIVPQSETEAILYRKLRDLGKDVEWNTPLLNLEETSDGVLAVFHDESKIYKYVVGCDGASSIVRKSLGIAFSGTTYDVRFLLSEVHITEDRLPTDATHVILAQDSVIAAIPLPNGAYRLVGPDRFANTEIESGVNISFDDFSAFLSRNGLLPNAGFQDPSRVVSYRMQKRVADSFQTSKVFLAGDAAHIHSPAGGQGMNMGIQDAVNLAWKLSLVQTGSTNQALLKSYGSERRTVALKVANGTDRALQLVGSQHWLHRLMLHWIAPVVYRIRQPHRLLHNMAQLAIAYGDGQRFSVGSRLLWFSLSNGMSSFDLLSPGRLTLIDLSNATTLSTSLPVRHVHLVDNRFFRLRPHAISVTEHHPVSSKELRRLSGAVRILVRPDGYLLAVDKEPASRDTEDALSALVGGAI